ncbi:MAG: bifunctional alpha,alpha-trehalose-phosphate synthase (UDP-forming)/trehalose-phosphatase [Planctomycetes bacterium]|nr:bifunctional alpha,alpha-trehalose-phosphate synthase (UDP-forming)/trehalose-phosphatase [Planctomycetota bacterium]
MRGNSGIVKDPPGRVIIVSNRLPVTVVIEGQEVKVVPSSGGLATGLGTHHERSGGLWIGWPGDLHNLKPEQRSEIIAKLSAQRYLPISLTKEEVERYYYGYANGILWPLFHYLLDRMPHESSGWEVYQQVNRRFADIVASHHQKGDLIWIHDYHLFLLPELLRQRIPEAHIGFFLHIPFPSTEIFRILPRRAELLRGILGADLIGFHTPSYLRHFSMSLLRILGIEAEIDRIWQEGREVRLGIYPMGIDASRFESYAQDPELKAEAETIRKEQLGAKILLGIDRLDYTKGIPRRLLTFEKLLERETALRERVRFIQVATLSRTEVEAYGAFKESVDEIVGRINGKFGTASYVPIHYVNRSLTQRQLAPLYMAADVMLVTPLRDGLNLVAKEFVACNSSLDGVLIVSEFAGAAVELAEALVVNPYDLDGVAEAIKKGLDMAPEERSSRMKAMRERVRAHDIHWWANRFMEDLSCVQERERRFIRELRMDELEAIKERIQVADQVAFFLDYDGTLSPFVTRPELAAPDVSLLELLDQLSRQPGISVHLVSGRERISIERWFGHLPITIHAEHGLWSRSPGRAEWIQNLAVSCDWKEKVRPILEEFIRGTPGSFVEEKSAGLAWHYRNADPIFGAAQAKELRLILFGLLSNTPVEVIAGEKVVEVRSQGIHKGSIVSRVLVTQGEKVLAVAIGDDRTDEELFAALSPDSIAIHVGFGPSRAPYRLASPAAVRSFLRSILSARVVQ